MTRRWICCLVRRGTKLRIRSTVVCLLMDAACSLFNNIGSASLMYRFSTCNLPRTFSDDVDL